MHHEAFRHALLLVLRDVYKCRTVTFYSGRRDLGTHRGPRSSLVVDVFIPSWRSGMNVCFLAAQRPVLYLDTITWAT